MTQTVWLRKNMACREARRFVKECGGLRQAYRKCDNAEWIRWLLAHVELSPSCTCDLERRQVCPLTPLMLMNAKRLRKVYPWHVISAKLKKLGVDLTVKKA